MTLDELVQHAAAIEYPAFGEPLDAFCQQHHLGFTEFSEQFARHVAVSYHEGSLDWSDADAAMNNLHAQFMLRAGRGVCLSEFAVSVHLAFDAGEYHPKTPHLSADEVSRPLVATLLPNHTLQRTEAGGTSLPSA